LLTEQLQEKGKTATPDAGAAPATPVQ
jgi:hypothetical protein